MRTKNSETIVYSYQVMEKKIIWFEKKILPYIIYIYMYTYIFLNFCWKNCMQANMEYIQYITCNIWNILDAGWNILHMYVNLFLNFCWTNRVLANIEYIHPMLKWWNSLIFIKQPNYISYLKYFYNSISKFLSKLWYRIVK